MKKAGFGVNKVVTIVLAVVLVAAVAAAGYFYKQAQDLRKPEGQQKAAEQAATDLKNKVSKLTLLPSETPTVATVQDISKLKDQPFFKDAKNGDKILIFTATKKAIVYRESENLIINSGPIAVTSDSSAKKIAILRSGNSNEATKTALSKLNGISIASEAKAAKSYTEPHVFDVSGNNGELAKQVAEAIGGKVVTSAPADETIPSGTELVVISTK